MSSHSSHLLGDAFGVITALFYTAFLIFTKRLRDAGYATAFIVSRATLITACALLPLALLSDGALYPTTLRGWSVLLALALISHAGGQTLIAYALAHLPAAFSSVTLMLEPVVAALLAWVLFGERLGPLEFAGAALVLTGIYLARRGSDEKEKAPLDAPP
jgi:drug/metabolite transporter (DMT)-like permease